MIQIEEVCVWSKTLPTRAKSEGRWHYLVVKKLSALLTGIGIELKKFL